MAKEQKDLGRKPDLGTQKPEVGKEGGEVGKEGGMPEKKEWEKEKGGVGTSHEPGRTGGTENPPR
jgi:hypothetical protein